ncbi:MAG TPA: beta galactosidase jelly roll domain-containing protein [Candidatus Hydrogenedentes bacterium]|nr:beta galactosidase jelly roll domain-containing protein [Candidatus Hydrogenedentota bacterium]HOL76616.1 beta galactosidase jelly roll domain-containing protein [Candidatus Hydrogenedentota bacterium]HPO84449.1 beta galactosidase jelly roll domain-containing protein [Candidatus Hydrogenedentota bacterium]
MILNKFFGVLVFLAGGLAAAQGAAPLFLTDSWYIVSSREVSASGETISQLGFDTQRWYKTAVPTTVLAALVENQVYPDPYYGENLKRIPGYKEGRWLVMPEGSPFRDSWWYRTEFQLPASFQGRFLSLHFDGINYRANVWLNGVQIGHQEDMVGMFRRFEFDITERVYFDRPNCLAVEIIPPGLLPEKEYRTKQVEATTGWDDHNPQPPDGNMGIWQPVYIRVTGPVEIKHPFVLSDLSVPDLETAKLTVSAVVVNRSIESVDAVVTGQIGKVSFSKTVFLKPRETQSIEWLPSDCPELVFSKPRVWWPHPLGNQELYELKLVADTRGQVSDSVNVHFGIRNITSTINEEGWRQFYVNGRKALIRGGAWMTSDMLLRLTPKRYDALVRYAREANLNMLRSEGFSIRETEDFFAACDRYGVMVTQQIFGRSIPDEALAVACTEDTILRIRNHPSLVHFLGHDETFPTPTLDAAYRDLIARYAPDRTYQPHSGAFDVAERFQTGGTRTGTRELWTYAGPAHYYERKEDGAWGFAQSGGIGGIVAPLDSVFRMIPKEQRWPIWTDALSFHTVIQGGHFFDVAVDMQNKRYGESTGIEEFCRKAQTLNYECARGMFEAYGRKKYSATGITTWKYNAAWPAFMTWHYVDWYLNATGAYYGAKKACMPIHVQYAYDDENVYVVNNLYKRFEGLVVRAALLDFNMKTVWEESKEVDCEEDSVTHAFSVKRPEQLTNVYFLYLTLTDKHGQSVDENFYWLSKSKDIRGEVIDDWRDFAVHPKSTADFRDLAQLPRVALQCSSEFRNKGKETEVEVRLHNPSDYLAFQVRLAILRCASGEELTPVFWDDNLIQILPKTHKSLKAVFYTEDLQGTDPHVSISGWNLDDTSN